MHAHVSVYVSRAEIIASHNRACVSAEVYQQREEGWATGRDRDTIYPRLTTLAPLPLLIVNTTAFLPVHRSERRRPIYVLLHDLPSHEGCDAHNLTGHESLGGGAIIGTRPTL